MHSYLLWLLGKSRLTVPPGGRVELTWLHRPHSWMVFPWVALVGGVLYCAWRLYALESEACTRARRRLLGGLRLAALLLLALVSLGPALVVSVQKQVEPWVLLLIDESLSMSVKDKLGDGELRKLADALESSPGELRRAMPSRAGIVDRLLQAHDQEFMRRLAAKGRVRVFTFSQSARLRQTIGRIAPDEVRDGRLEKGDPVPPLTPAGRATNLARSLRAALRSVTGGRVAAVVLVSDGRNTAGDDPLDYARALGENAIRVVSVGVGDPRPPRNLRVADLWVPDTVFRGDPVKVGLTLAAEGLAGREVEVEVAVRADAEEGEGGGETVIARKRVRLADGTQVVNLRYRPQRPGSYVLIARAGPLPGEILETDNLRSAAVRVSERRMRVLLVAGGPSWEYRLVKNLLLRERTVDLSCWLQSMDADMSQEGNTPIKRLPSTPAELFAYDAVMFFDPSPDEFTESWLRALDLFVGKHAGGMAWSSGPQHEARFLVQPRTRSVRKLLPVKFDDRGQGVLEAIGASRTRAWPLRVRPEAADHPLLQCGKSGTVAWGELPGVFWSFPALEPKPGAQCLLELEDPRLRTERGYRPLLVAGQYGAGRVLYLGFASTWRWRRGGVNYFDRFWTLAVRFLVEGRLAAGGRRGHLLTDRDIYTVGDRVGIKAVLYDAEYQPLELDGFEVKVFRAGSAAGGGRMRPVKGRPGRYEGSLLVRRPGVYRLQAVVGGEGGASVRLVRRFTVETPRLEFADPRADRPLLEEFARRTGGRYFDIWDLARVPASLPDEREVTVVRQRPQMLWDTSHLLLLLVGLLSLEWFLRRRWRLL